jgi:hypothetical protein
MKLNNDAFQEIIDIFEGLITEHLNSFKRIIEKGSLFNSSNLLQQIEDILKADDKITKIKTLDAENKFFKINDDPLNNSSIEVRRLKSKQHLVLSIYTAPILDLIEDFERFEYILNKDNQKAITVQDAIELIVEIKRKIAKHHLKDYQKERFYSNKHFYNTINKIMKDKDYIQKQAIRQYIEDNGEKLKKDYEEKYKKEPCKGRWEEKAFQALKRRYNRYKQKTNKANPHP